MRLLPSQQAKRATFYIEEFEKHGSVEIYEPCDCGGQIRHNNGGNYHQIIHLVKDQGKLFMKGESTSEFGSAEWEEINYERVVDTIRKYADWLS